MSLCKEVGKDKIIFLTKEDHEKPSTVVIPEDDEPRGLILPNGEINWNCPCLGGMASGPCGFQFREAFSCFHTSVKDDNKERGAECIDKFVSMHECMQKYPNVYPRDKEDDDDPADFQKMVDEDNKGNEVGSSASGGSITQDETTKQLER